MYFSLPPLSFISRAESKTDMLIADPACVFSQRRSLCLRVWAQTGDILQMDKTGALVLPVAEFGVLRRALTVLAKHGQPQVTGET